MKDLLLTFKTYLQKLIKIRDGNEVAGDRETLKILKKELEKGGLNENNKKYLHIATKTSILSKSIN